VAGAGREEREHVTEIRLTVTYPAPPGSTPTVVEMYWATEPDPATVSAVLAQLLNRAVPPVTLSAPVRAMSSGHCRRSMCGHARAEHARVDDKDNDMGAGGGFCLACNSHTRCPSFLGAGGT
jgi:hypothetical protein